MNHSPTSENTLAYQLPPAEMVALIDKPLSPSLLLDSKKEWLLMAGVPTHPSIAELSQPELRLAGLRLRPQTAEASRSSYFNSLTLKRLSDGAEYAIAGLPTAPHLKNLRWSPDDKWLVFTHTSQTGLELWLADLTTRQARQVCADWRVCDVFTTYPLAWLPDSATVVCRVVMPHRSAPPSPPLAPVGPAIQISEAGKKSIGRTYQDLLKNAHDEALFEYHTTSQILKIHLPTETVVALGAPAIFTTSMPSPDGNYLLIQAIQRPFSYLLPYDRFGRRVEIWDLNGKLVTRLSEHGLLDNIPQGFGAVQNGRRSFMWRADAPAAVYWVEALDGGDPRTDAPLRDRLFGWNAPFEGEPLPSLDFALRFGGITWGDGGQAIASEWWWASRREITSSFAPDAPLTERTVLFDQNWEDQYRAHGRFCTVLNERGKSVLARSNDGETAYLMGVGASERGNYPFLDSFNLKTKEKQRLWQCEPPFYEVPLMLLDIESRKFLIRRESNQQQPNYFICTWGDSGVENQITSFPHPYEQLKNVQKELVSYQRADGVPLTGTLYLPAGYRPATDPPLPTLIWAYPREFKTKDAAGQVTNSPHEFLRIGAQSPIFWVTQGFAVFDDFSVPVIGEGENEPNEQFILQLKLSAEAAVNYLVRVRKVSAAGCIAVGGDSYGAFMTANLLAHTDLFAAGIARSGAYNRTLTPFGFQSEERMFWEAPETYMQMSPFAYAHCVRAPLLLIHGEADDNPGTFPMQSERFFAALKSLGAEARLVLLPHEGHGYRGRESILHVLWEMDGWLKRYCTPPTSPCEGG